MLFVGYVEASSGLSESLRGLIGALAQSDVLFGIYPISRYVETRIIGPFKPEAYDHNHRYQVNLIEMMADQVPACLRELGWRAHHSYNILRTYWELSRAPQEWAASLTGIDEIWVANRFVGDAFSEIFNGPIIVVPPCVSINAVARYPRRFFSMEKGIFYFTFSFDYFSYPERKNPLAVLRTFQSAFPDRGERVGLVIKTMKTGDPHYLQLREALQQAAHTDCRIRIIEATLSREAMLAVLSHSDCYISLHRSEGFGLGLAEAMAFGKPVIGTNYSGNTDFLSEKTGFPVPYTLKPVSAGEYPFWETGQLWAEPDEAAAAEIMRRVFDDAQEREFRASAGKALIEARYGRQNVGQIAGHRLHQLLRTRLRKRLGSY